MDVDANGQGPAEPLTGLPTEEQNGGHVDQAPHVGSDASAQAAAPQDPIVSAILEPTADLIAKPTAEAAVEPAVVRTEVGADMAAVAPGGSASPEAAPEPKKRRKWGPPVIEAAAAAPTGEGAAAPPAVGGATPTPPPDAPTGAEGDAGEGERRRKRRSRWEESEEPAPQLALVPVGEGQLVAFPKEIMLSGGIKVQLPSTITGEMQHADPRVRELHEELETLNKKLQRNELDIPPEGDPRRSPSPEPVYDRNGIRQNTREIRHRERLLDHRNRVVEELMKEDASFKPPADYRPKKYWKKVAIPQDVFPNYNFIGLIIGPRGNTQKRMQKETNTKIAIRGRGSVKEGASRDPKYDYGEDEELHVLITGDRQDDVDKAVEMIERLLEPNDDTLNEHKRLQLRELAALNGTLKDEVACYICGETTHRSTECPKSQAVDIYKLPDDIKAKVEEQYARDVARMQGGDGRGMEDEYKSFLRELGGAPPPEMMGDLSALEAREGGRSGLGRPRRPGDDLPDDHKLYVAGLPSVFNDSMLRSMFEPFGNVLHATVAMDGAGNSRNFGFVHYPDPATAKAARDGMDGRMIEGRSLTVRLRSERPGERRGPPGGAPPGALDGVDDACKLYIGQLPFTTSEQVVRPMFEPFGQILELRLIRDRETGNLKGFGFLTMGTPAAANAAMRALHGTRVDGKTIVVKPAGQPPGAGRGEGRGEGRGDDRGPPRHDGMGRTMGPGGGPPPHGHYPVPGPAPPPGAPPPGGPHPPPGGPPPPGHYPPPGGPPYAPSGPPPPYPPAYPPPGHYPHAMYGAPYGAPPPGAPPPPYGAPPPAPPGGAYPPPAPPGGGYPPYGAPPDNPYGAAPPMPYGAPPPAPYGYGAAQAPYGAAPSGEYPGYAPPPPAYPPPLPPSAPPPPPPDSSAGGGGQGGGQPPLPPSGPSGGGGGGGGAGDSQQLSEYERFMAEMQRSYA